MFLSGLLLTPCYASEKDKPKAVTEDSTQRVERESKSERLLKTELILKNTPKLKGVILAEKTYLGHVTRRYSYQPYTRISGWGGEAVVNVGPLVSEIRATTFPIYSAKVREETGDTICTESYNSAAGAPNTGRYYDIAAVYDAKYNPGDTVFFSLDKYGHFIVDEDWLKDGVSRERDALTRTDKSCPEPQVRDW